MSESNTTTNSTKLNWADESEDHTVEGTDSDTEPTTSNKCDDELPTEEKIPSWVEETHKFIQEVMSMDRDELRTKMKDSSFKSRFLFKSKWCVRGDKCRYKDKCHYAHNDEELRPPICNYGDRCRNKECSFYHIGDAYEFEHPKKPVPRVTTEKRPERRTERRPERREDRRPERREDPLDERKNETIDAVRKERIANIVELLDIMAAMKMRQVN